MTTAEGADPEEAIRAVLEEAAEGLVYSSEADHAFEYFTAPPGAADDPPALAAFLGLPADTPVSTVALDDFLRHHIEEADPLDARAVELRPRYERLRAVLEAELEAVRVIRVGEVEVHCLLVGHDRAGRLTGLVTHALET